MNEVEDSLWCYLPYPALYKIFQHLSYKELISTGNVCKLWFQASRNDLLWRDLFYQNFLVDRSVPVVAGGYSYLSDNLLTGCNVTVSRQVLV